MVDEQELTELTPIIGINFAIMLNALFFLAGYFTPLSYKKGTKNYFISRMKRIGAPFLLFACLIFILKYSTYISSGSHGYIGFFHYFIHYYLGFGEIPLYWNRYGWPDLTYAHFWFLEYLIVFSIGYILMRKIRDILKLKKNPKSKSNNDADNDTGSSIPSIRKIWIFILIVAFITFIVRIWFSAGVWIVELLILLIEPAHITLNIAFFVIGIIAFKKEWLKKISKNDAKFWAINGIIALILPFIANGYRPLNHPENFGGLTIGSALFCIWELYFAISWLIFLLWLFREKINYSTQISLWLSDNSYVSYMFHGFIILAIQMAFIKVNWPVLIKFILVVIIGLPLSYGSAYIFRKLIPFAEKHW